MAAASSSAPAEEAPAPAAVSTHSRQTRSLPWVEKYRPSGIGDISSQEDIVRSLRAAITSGSIPHLLFYGPPGTGKTSTILALARDIYGPALMRSRVMELNASDERGIAVIREKVKAFAMASVGGSSSGASAASGSSSSSSSGGTPPPFKLIILDEADSLTPDAQAALRRTMETYSKATRFCIICNYVSRIIEPLASRCSKYRFKPLDAASVLARLGHVASSEGLTIAPGTLEEVLRVSGGDMRKAITFLQSASALYGGSITPAGVIEISGLLPDREAAGVIETLKTGSFIGVRNAALSIVAAGYGMNTVLDRLQEAIIKDVTLPALAKAVACERLAAMEKALIDGADEELQLVDALLAIHRAITDRVRVASDKERELII